MKKYTYRKPSKNYKILFQKEKTKLKKILPKAKIEHIGSTSIPNLGGKGIIDILIGVSKKDIKKSKNTLIKNNYKFKQNAGSKERLFFEKDYGFFKKRRIHLQLTTYKSKVWDDSLKFKDKIIKNPKLLEKYSNIKKQAIAKNLKAKEYREYKSKFIKEVLK